MEIIIGIGVVVLLVVIWFATTYNHLVSLKTKVKEGFSTIDIFLKKRYDLIPNLLETVKGYMKHEKDTLEAIVNARGKAIECDDNNQGKAEGELSSALGRLFALTENYPDLKADSQFISLQSQLSSIEGEIEKSRRYYNGVVRENNIYVQKIPSCIVASMCKFIEYNFFEIENKDERENVKIKF